MTHEFPAGKQSEPNHYSRPKEISATARKFIFLSVFTTFFLNFFVVEGIKRHYFDDIEQLFRANKFSEKSDKPPEIFDISFDQIPDHELENLSSQFVYKYGPEKIYAIYEELIREDKNSKKFAVFFLEKGALRYKTSSLFLRTGLEYSLGRFLHRDYLKAKKYLTDPILSKNQVARYYLALIYLAPDNPSPDEVRGLEILNQLAESGFAAAQKNLLNRRSAN